jgi:hypothetical protein
MPTSEMPKCRSPAFSSKEVSPRLVAFRDFGTPDVKRSDFPSAGFPKYRFPISRYDRSPTPLCVALLRLRGFHPRESGFLVSRTSEMSNPGMPKCRLPIASLQRLRDFMFRDPAMQGLPGPCSFDFPVPEIPACRY